jgi:hypothetical protein
MNPIDRLVAQQKELDRKRAENAVTSKRIQGAQGVLQASEEMFNKANEAFVFLEELALAQRTEVKDGIQGTVTEALRLIFGDQYRVEFGYGVKNNRSSLEIEMVRDTPSGEVRRTLGGFGGSVADCISVPLRLMILVTKYRDNPVCVFDESFKHVDSNRITRVAQFLSDVSEKLGLQVIMLSHHAAMKDAADAAFRIENQNGKSLVKKT